MIEKLLLNQISTKQLLRQRFMYVEYNIIIII